MATIPTAAKFLKTLKSKTVDPRNMSQPDVANKKIAAIASDSESPYVSSGKFNVFFAGDLTATPLRSVVDVFPGDQVLVEKIGKEWLITGNISSPITKYSIIKKADQSRTTTTLANDSELSLLLPTPVVARANAIPARYLVEFRIIVGSGTTGQINTAISYSMASASINNTRQVIGPGTSTTNANDGSNSRYGGHLFASGIPFGARTGGNGNFYNLYQWAVLEAGSTVTFQWAQNATDAIATIVASGSNITATRLHNDTL